MHGRMPLQQTGECEPLARDRRPDVTERLCGTLWITWVASSSLSPPDRPPVEPRKRFPESLPLPLPATAETLADYVAHLADAGRSASTIEQAMAAIRTRHRSAGHLHAPDTRVVNAW